jgi:predicted Rossmann fold nucleotide-binding protein DprA/Smf involved in DNA uptake
MNDFLTEDTKVIALLCGILGTDRSEKPLSLKEYSSLVRWLIGVNMRPADLLQKERAVEASMGANIDRQRLEFLLGRGGQLGFAVEEWQRNGIWLVSRSDTDYPTRYKQHFKDKAPPLLFGVGDRVLLKGGGLGIVGSRNVDRKGEHFTRQVAELCACHRMPVVSGGARGVDQISMTAALEAGGVSIGILAENLLKKSIERQYRHAIADGRLLLLSPYHPAARFTVGTAMGRNKLIYGMADYGLVVNAEHKKGGTWAGAEEELKRNISRPVFVRVGNDIPRGNYKLLDLGAIPWPESIGRKRFRQQLFELAAQSREKRQAKNPDLFDYMTTQKGAYAEEFQAAKTPINEEAPVIDSGRKAQKCPVSIYQAVLPVILNKLDNPMTTEKLSETLDVNKTQLNVWLKKAVDEKKIIKLSKPVRYQKAASRIHVCADSCRRRSGDGLLSGYQDFG